MSKYAILHPATLLGKELRERLGARPAFAERDPLLLTTDEEEVGNLTDVAGAAAFVGRWQEGELDTSELAFFCGTAKETREVLKHRPSATTAVVLAPDAEAGSGRTVVAGVNSVALKPGSVFLSPHPAVILLAHLLQPLRAFGVEEAVATVIQPASMHGEPGLQELFEDTRRIYTMGGRKKTPVFGQQLAFNLLPARHEPDLLAAQLGEVLAGEPPVALEIIQGGILHSVSASLWVRMANDPGGPALRKALGRHPHLMLSDNPKLLGPIDASGETEILVGNVRRDAGPAGGTWIWAVMDNLTRGGVINALEIAEAVLEPPAPPN